MVKSNVETSEYTECHINEVPEQTHRSIGRLSDQCSFSFFHLTNPECVLHCGYENKKTTTTLS